MLTYVPDDTLAHRLDPRSKLAVQLGFAAAALTHTGPRAILVLSALAIGMLAAAGVSPIRAVIAARYALVILSLAPLLAALTLGPPWIETDAGLTTALASYRVLLVLLVSTAAVRSTRVRDSRAAIQRTIPGRPGHLLGIGVALLFRFLPVLRADIQTIRDAMAARLGAQRHAHERAGTIALLGLSRAFDRADRLSLALRARCFAWNPTLPPLSFSRLDIPALLLATTLLCSTLLTTIPL
ncbi:energy-coupling factor transporter transmembrane component T family protein [Natrialba aegyptia]|uniref:Cobalt transporter n=1 Tax=Natrialba aegyptia DSM 13077 TaxID=1227491 RepID=M0B3T0_9EURY|nr:energy-coupling factor transporter transmembrane component T [Natrialba aegyptia]ELZ04329.1 cobalt transporter [Natrialba aegyptia DSM 13077]